MAECKTVPNIYNLPHGQLLEDSFCIPKEIGNLKLSRRESKTQIIYYDWNLRFVNPTFASREEVIEVAKKARCYDFIMKLPNGFDTVIGEGGADLSGGEQQRISIARCMLKDAPIVILDEATASVDADNEHFIQEAISELCRGKTLIVIAHRLNTIRNANCILVIKDGQIVESGSHDQLIAANGEYANMVSKQVS